MVSLVLLLLSDPALPAAPPNDIEITEYASADSGFRQPTHIAFRDGLEIITDDSRLLFREKSAAPFRPSPLDGLKDAHNVAYNPRDELFYVTDSGNHRLVSFRDPSRGEIAKSAARLAGVALDRPHDIVCDGATGWMYALNPNKGEVFRFKGFGQDESSLDLSKHLGYSRSLSFARGTLYVVGSSAGKVVEIDDFQAGKYTIYNSFGKRRDAPAGSWKTTGLVPNDADFYEGYWYMTSYFCPQYAAGEDCNENKFIRFKTWRDFESGDWEDLSGLLPKDIVPYYLTPRKDGLYLAAFYHEGQGGTGTVFRTTTRDK
jgi:hypothetical protein